MNENVELMAKLNLVEAGIPLWLSDDWYQEIYIEPDIQVAIQEMDAALAKVQLQDLIPVLAPYLITNADEEAIRRTVKWARELFGVKMEPEIRFSAEVSLMESWFSCQEKSGIRWRLIINPHRLRDESVDFLIGAVAHEVWHGYQRECAKKWEGCLGIVLTKMSMKDKHELMRALNQTYVVASKQDPKIYMSQLIEAEAYALTGKVCEMLVRILTEAYRRGEIPRQMLVATTSLNGRSALAGTLR